MTILKRESQAHGTVFALIGLHFSWMKLRIIPSYGIVGIEREFTLEYWLNRDRVFVNA